MGREVGVGIGMGKTCEPKAFSFQCMTKFTTNKKKKRILVADLNTLLPAMDETMRQEINKEIERLKTDC